MRWATPWVFVLSAAATLAVDRETVSGVMGGVAEAASRARPAVARPGAVASAMTVVTAMTAPTPGQPLDDDWGHLRDEGAEETAASEAVTEDAADDEDAADLDEGPPVLISIGRETWVYAEPRWRSRRLGYLRAGAVVERAPEPAGYRSCQRGWYRVEPRGYVCVGKRATLDRDHPVARLSARRPRTSELPYLYVTSRFPTPPMYARLPSPAEQKRFEPDLHHKLGKYARITQEPDFVPLPEPDPMPELLTQRRSLPGLGGVNRGSLVYLGQAGVRSGFALLGSYDHEGRRFGMTTELALIPLDGTRVVAPSTLRGVPLSDELELPIAFVKSKRARSYALDETSGAFRAEEPLAYRSVLALTGQRKHVSGTTYFETRAGSWIRSDQAARIDRFDTPPRWAKGDTKWIDVSILRQALVAYEGQRPVYATLVSTGRDGLMDHETTHSTIQGTFLIHTKHVSVTMDGDEQGDEFDLRDVPFVQYFTEGYALHGAYWHDEFGTPRSHGCINLAPRDAAWLFRWTDPHVPEGWHAALELKKGTIVYIHP